MRTLLENGAFFESPRWHEDRWWLSDFYRHRVLTVTEDGREETVLEVEGQPSGLGWLPDGSLLVVSMRDRRILRWDGSSVTLHADVAELCGGHLNDMVVDARGRAYAGNFGFDLMAFGDPAPANLIRVDPDGTASVAAEEMLFPNGSVITPDGRTLIVGETAGARYTAFTISATARSAAAVCGRRWPRRPRSPRSRRRWASCASGPTAAGSTPRGTSGRPTRSMRAVRGSPRAARSSTRSRCRKG